MFGRVAVAIGEPSGTNAPLARATASHAAITARQVDSSAARAPPGCNKQVKGLGFTRGKCHVCIGLFVCAYLFIFADVLINIAIPARQVDSSAARAPPGCKQQGPDNVRTHDVYVIFDGFICAYLTI